MSNERVTNGNLPHWYKPGYAHFVTYRLSGSIPRHLLRKWRAERLARLDAQPPGEVANRERAHKLFFKCYDDQLDISNDVPWLRQTSIAELVRENLYHHHTSLYQLLSWCVMPNHVHILIQPLEKHVPDTAVSDEVPDGKGPLAKIMHSLKSYTANKANEILNRRGPFWQAESYDHWVRDMDELERVHNYILMNPVKAGLCERPEQWRFSSCFDRFQIDGSKCGLVGELKDDWAH